MPCIWQRLNNWSVDWEWAIEWEWAFKWAFEWAFQWAWLGQRATGHGLVTQVPAKLSINSQSMPVIMQVG